MGPGAGRKLLFYLILAGLGLALLELGSWAVISGALYARAHYLPWGKAARDVHRRDGVDFDELRRELAFVLQTHVKLQPYRWYALPESYRGQYVSTDPDGFRRSPAVTGDTPLIGFFGSSTMFSVTTRDEQSIPAYVARHLDAGAVQAKNYGVGGYSSSTELALLIERARADKLAVAVFYDGSAEVVNYLEKLQYHATEPYYEVMGFPTPYSYLPAIRNAADAQELAFEPYTLELVRRIRQQLASSGNANVMIDETNVGGHADAVVALYLRNVRDIVAIAEAHGIVPVFAWNPSVYTTRKPLSEYERQVFAQQPAERLLTQAVHERVADSADLKRYRFVDLTDALDGLDDATYFLDETHVSFEANQLIAEKLSAALREVTPAGYWKAAE